MGRNVLELLLILCLFIGVCIGFAMLWGFMTFIAWVIGISVWWVFGFTVLFNIFIAAFMKGRDVLDEPIDIDFTDDEDIL